MVYVGAPPALTTDSHSNTVQRMHVVLRTRDRALLSLSQEELLGVSNAVNAICDGAEIKEAEFETRLGVTRELLRAVLHAFRQVPMVTEQYERCDVWSDESSVQVICITANGDPVDMGCEEARTLKEKLENAIAEAD
jgi:hypothetical protein